MDKKQIGNTEKPPSLLIKISGFGNPPLYYFTGEDVYKAAKAKINALQDALKTGKIIHSPVICKR